LQTRETADRLPSGLRDDVAWHLAQFAEGGPNGRFLGAQGGLDLHGLRHTGSTWSARIGATFKKLVVSA
jgi:hypothetical protein